MQVYHGTLTGFSFPLSGHTIAQTLLNESMLWRTKQAAIYLLPGLLEAGNFAPFPSGFDLRLLHSSRTRWWAWYPAHGPPRQGFLL